MYEQEAVGAIAKALTILLFFAIYAAPSIASFKLQAILCASSEVGWDAYKRVADQLMIMLDNTGLLHGYSFNSWSDVVTYDRNFVEEWLLSPQTSLYYSLQVMGDVQDKSDAYAALDKSEVDDYLQDILGNEPITCDCQE